jgi:hypothetical protein
LREFAALAMSFVGWSGAAGSHGIKEVSNAMVSFSSSGNTIQVGTLGLLAFLEK